MLAESDERILTVGCGAILTALLLAVPLRSATLRAGVAEADITPPAGLPMYGYMDRTRPASGTLDPLFARVLVLEAGERRVALVTLDLGRTFGESSLERLRAAARRSSRISFLIVTASHTHSGPNILDEYPAGRTPAWETAALDQITKAIESAASHLADVRLGTGYGRVYVGYNRRVVHPNGNVTMLWSNPEKIPTAPLDPTVAVLRLDRADGQPLAILVNYACHPVVFGADNLQYSADFVGVMAKTVEQAFDGKPLCFFLQGADGDINPYDATTPLEKDAVKKRDWTGQQLGREAARVAGRIRTEANPSANLDVADDLLTFPFRWDPERFQKGLLQAFGPRVFEDHADLLAGSPPRRELQLHLTTLVVNKRVAFVGMPGEPFVEFQINWRARCPARDAFFLGYANGYFDYFPTIRAASEGGYGAGDSDTYVEVGAGERMLELLLVRVYGILGRLRDAPEE